MEPTSFLPKLPAKSDAISRSLMRVARITLGIGMVLSLLLFIPGAPGLLGPSKVYFLLAAILLVVVCTSLAILRSGAVAVRFVPVLMGWWALVLAGVISALLSPTLLPSLFGDALEIHTVGFIALLGLVMTLVPVVGMSKRAIVYVYGGILGVTALLVAYHYIRLFTGPAFLSFGQFNNAASTLIGSFNDLGLLVGSMILLLLVAVLQLQLTTRVLGCVAVATTLLLGLLTIVNFFIIWLILGLFSLLVLMYSLTKDRFGVSVGERPVGATKTSIGTIGIIAMVFVVSTVFMIGGTNLGTAVSNLTGVSYLEVRPSVTATISIMREVYSENLLTGSGPNRFVEMWQLHKDPAIMQTIFWDTPFNAGSGYVPTWFIATGALGLIAWVFFLFQFCYTGITMLVRGQSTDEFWYFVGTSSFVLGFFVWLMSVVYVPGPAILIFGAVCTGIMLVAHQALLPKRMAVFNMLTTARTGFILIAIVMVVIISSVAVGYGAMRQGTAAYTFVTAATAVTPGSQNPAGEITGRIIEAFRLHQSDTFAREIALYNQLQLNALLSLPSVTAEQQQQVEATVATGLTAARDAVALKPTDARNAKILGDLYAVLAVNNIEGARERANEAFSLAESRDPQNPYYVLQKSIMAYRANDVNSARSLVMQAIALKPNYTEAIFLLSQIDIAANDVKKAIDTTLALVQLEPQNPARYYQLGVLYSADNNREGALAAFGEAIVREPAYANALYLRGLEYVRAGETERALADLEKVRDLNPDNDSIKGLVDQVRQGTVSTTSTPVGETIPEGNSVSSENEVTTSDTVPDTNLLTPVNTPTESAIPSSETTE